jgi:hypothetical protein
MARYQLRRPSPVKVFPRRVRRQIATVTPAPEEEEEEGPESPDSPESSPSTVGEQSESEDSDSDDEEEEEEQPSPVLEQAYNGTQSGRPSLATFSSVPQITGATTLITSIRPSITATESSSFSSRLARPSNPTATSSADVLPVPAQSDTEGPHERPQSSSPQVDTTITNGSIAAAISLSILGNHLPNTFTRTFSNKLSGAIALVVAVFVLFKRRKCHQQHAQRLADDAFDPGNTGSLHAPETAHIAPTPLFAGIGTHLTRSTERSNTLFGAGPYARPETVSTEEHRSHLPNSHSIAPPLPTPNPFADPPLNKAYDVLAGRPRSTTLTDRGSWVANPFKDPDSERFDPFGELQQKARNERKKQLQKSRKEAERAREAEARRRFREKEKTGLSVPESALERKGSGVTIEGLGVLDRSGGGGEV